MDKVCFTVLFKRFFGWILNKRCLSMFRIDLINYHAPIQTNFAAACHCLSSTSKITHYHHHPSYHSVVYKTGNNRKPSTVCCPSCCHWCCSSRENLLFSNTDGIAREEKTRSAAKNDLRVELNHIQIIDKGCPFTMGKSESVKKRKQPNKRWTSSLSSSRKRSSISSSSNHNVIFVILVLILGMCQVSGECPAVCECKWKSGKESVICANAKAKLTEIPSGLDPGTQVLNLSRNSIKTLPSNVFLSLNLLNLQKICLSECSLKSLDRLAFAKLKNLVELDLSGNRQEFIPSHSFSQIPELRDLKINSNPISRLSNDAFIDLGRLVRLELSGCRIGTIEVWAFRGLPALEWLRLDNNRLFAVQATSFFPLRSLHGIEIHGNPWNCSCTLQPFRDWMGKSNVPFGVPPVCSQPQRLVGKLWNELGLEDFACLPKLHKIYEEASTSGSSGSQQKTRKILEGENTTLTCQWEATPDTKIRWWNGNKPVGTNGGSGIQSGFMVSESFRWESRGGERHNSKSSGGLSSGSSFSSSRGAGDTDSKSLEFSTTSILHGRNQTSFSGIGIKTSSLVVIRTTPRDAGTYSCKAESRAGSVIANYTLIVVQNKTEHLTGRFLLFGAVIAALLTLVVSLLLVCVVFGSNRRHYQSSRISTDDKLELNHVGGTHILRQNGGGSVPLVRNHHHQHNDSHYYNPRQNSSNHSSSATTNVTTNSILSMRTMSNGENNGGSISGSDKGREYKAVPTTEPDDSSSEIENNGSEHEDGEVGQDESLTAISTTAIVAATTTTTATVTEEGMGMIKDSARNNSRVDGLLFQQQHGKLSQNPFSFSLTKKFNGSQQQQCKQGETKIGFVEEKAKAVTNSISGNSLISSEERSKLASAVRCASGSNGKEVDNEDDDDGGGDEPSGFSNSRLLSKHFNDKYPDLIDKEMSSLNSDFASLPRANKNHQQKQQQPRHHPHQMPYKQQHYAHQKQHLADTTRGYFHRRNNSDSQSPLLSHSYGNSTEKITSSGISILSSSSTESSYMSTYQPPPYTISQGHHNNLVSSSSSSSHYRGGSYKGSAVTNFHHSQNHNPFMPGYSSNYPTRQRLSMPTSPVHDHYLVDRSAPGALHHHSGSHDEGRNGLLSPTEPGISYVRTKSGPVGSASNVSYDYHAAQLAAFLEEYRTLQLELMRMSASLQNQGATPPTGGSGGGNHHQQGINSPPSEASSLGNSNSINATHETSVNVNNAGMLFKSSSSHSNTQGSSPQQLQHHHHQHHQQLKSILKNSGNNNNYVA